MIKSASVSIVEAEDRNAIRHGVVSSGFEDRVSLGGVRDFDRSKFE